MGKLCKDQLIGKLVALLQEADPDRFDEAVKEAKDQLVTEAKKVKREDLEKLFDSQIRTIKDRGCPEQIVEVLQGQKSQVLQKASEMSFGEGNIPFIPVIPRTYLSPYSQMAMVQNNEKQGYSVLNPTAITDEFDTPKEPYYIYDVEDGRGVTLGKTPGDAGKMIEKQGRLRHTVAEDMALAMHTGVLSHHYLWSTGSRYGSSGRAPDLCLNDGRPRLGWYYVSHSHSKWGSASCGSR